MASFTAAVSNLKLKMGSASCSVGSEIGICTGSLITDG